MREIPIQISTVGIGAAVAPFCTWAQPQSNAYDCGWGPQMMGWGGGWYGMFIGPLMMVLVLGALIGAVVVALRWSGVTAHGSARERMPLDILKERFARGEIDKEEFEERRRLLDD